jgi:threonyl-tRNA synthetase
MRILLIHSDEIEVSPKQKAIKDAEESPKGFDVKDAIVVFTAVEKDDLDADSVAAALVKEIEAYSAQVKEKKVVLYPYVHLTSQPSPPGIAKDVLEKAGPLLEKAGFQVWTAPFGWYKAFTLKSKGHPLSELSRQVGGAKAPAKKDDEESASLKAESLVKSRFCILDTEGKLTPVEEYKFQKGNLEKLATYETKKVRAYQTAPPHIKIMQDLELVDYEPGSDSGNMRFYPKGRMVKKLLERYITEMCLDYGAFEVETPLMYDYEHPSLKKYLNRFPARQYTVLSDEKRLFLRFAACFGQFLMSHDSVMSYRHLPVKLFELARYSFRREQSGELAGLKRLRAFTMPDMHTLVARDSGMAMAKQEFEKQFGKSMEFLESIGVFENTEVAFRAQEDFFNENRDWYVGMAKKIGKPILLEIFKERYAYFITKFEFNFIDAMDKASALSTVQIDVENADTYDISYADDKGGKIRPYILHASLSGAIERDIYALLEKEAMEMKKGKKGMFPLWLSPAQLRIVPVSNDKHLEFAKKLAEKIKGRNVRIEVDDREETLPWKVRAAEKEWTPYIAVVGDREIESGKAFVTIRGTGEKKAMSIDEIADEIGKKCSMFPFEMQTFPMLLSKRPVFRNVL